MYGDQFGEFVCGYWGLKGYKSVYLRYFVVINSLYEQEGTQIYLIQ